MRRVNAHTTTETYLKLFSRSAEGKTQHTCFIPEENKEIILQHLQFSEKVFPQDCLTVCPLSHPGFKYFSKNCEHILGHDHETLSRMDLPSFFNLIHSSDLHAVQQCLAYIKSQEPFDPTKMRFQFNFRLKHKNGSFAHIRHDHFAVKSATDTYLYLMLFCNISDEEKFYHVKMDIYKNDRDKFLKVGTYNPQQSEREITPRQKDIVQLIIKGFSNQQIADLLNVSIYTVKNHKQQLFKKVNVKNSIELANYAGRLANNY